VRGLLAELARIEPDALFISTQNEYGFERVLRQAREVLGEVQVLGAAMPGSRLFQRLAGALADGIVYVSEPSLEDVLTPHGQDFLSEFRARFGEPETGDYAVALTHAAFFAMDRAHAAGGLVAQNLKSMSFDDPALGRFRFVGNEITSQSSPKERNKFASHRIMVIESGAAKPRTG
jgi:ABC-type branched-subunit amino acid transport system substrate-binding protein